MTEKKGAWKGVVTIVVSVVSATVSVVSLIGVMADKSNASAQFVQETKTRLNAIEGRNKTADATNARWRGIVAQSVSRANFLCITNPECERLFGRIEVKEQ